MRRELIALGVLLLAAVAFPAALLSYQEARTTPRDARVIELVGRAPDAGGWSPDTIRVNVGERVRLRVSSPDVVHGLAIPGLGVEVDEILPGHVQEVEFVANRAGRYPFACTRWCSIDHWRMRGVVEVLDRAGSELPPASYAPPLYQQLRLDIDAPHPARHVPRLRPSAARGATSVVNFSGNFRADSLDAVFTDLRAKPAYRAWDDLQLWDALAYAYAQDVRAQALARGGQLYARDCAACHGERGDGTGPAGRTLPGLSAMHPEMPRGPANFTDAASLLGASDALLQGKVLRGGMGTGMPEWGSLYSEQELWDVVAFVRSFTLDLKLDIERQGVQR